MANEYTLGPLRLAMRSLEDAEKLRAKLEGQSYYDAGNTTYKSPSGTMMTTQIEPSSPETREAGYPYTLVVDCSPEEPRS